MSAAWPETSLARVVAATVKGARLASGRRTAGGPPGAGLAAPGAGPAPGGRGRARLLVGGGLPPVRGA